MKTAREGAPAARGTSVQVRPPSWRLEMSEASGARSAIAVTPKRNLKGGLDCVGPVSVRRLGANIGCDGPMTSMTVLEDEIDDWGEMTNEERDRLRAMLLDLGLDETDDPDVFE